MRKSLFFELNKFNQKNNNNLLANITICQTYSTLSSSTEATTRFSFWFHDKSVTFERCPPCMKSSSGSPSWRSSCFSSYPHLLISHTMTRLSAEQLENTPTLKGDHSQRRTFLEHKTNFKICSKSRKISLFTWSVCPWKVCSLLEVFLRSQKATVLSSEPVRKRYSLKGLKSKQ